MQKPCPPIYVGGHARKAIERAARLGDHYLISTTQGTRNVARLVGEYHQALRTCGLAEKSPALNRIVCVVPNQAEKRVAERLYAEIGIGHIACLMNFASPDLALVERSMRLFGEQVIPHFS